MLRKSKKCVVTKWRLYFGAMKGMFVISILFSLFCLFLMIFLQIRETGWNIPSISQPAIEALRIFLFFSVLLTIGCLPLVLKGIMCLKKQEKTLRLKFNEEMKKNQIYSTNYKDKYWFISVHMTRIIVFHIDYIISVDNVKRKSTGSGFGLWEADVTGLDSQLLGIKMPSLRTVLRPPRIYSDG